MQKKQSLGFINHQLFLLLTERCFENFNLVKMKDVNGARGGRRDVALHYFTQINRPNNILLGHLKEIREEFIVHLWMASSFSSAQVLPNECSPFWCQTRRSGPSGDPGVPCQTTQ